ncbi:MAG: hypothetical protein IBX41_07905, partial [Methanophagales archaeon]|nr:hypothetical protein [Methanophagales archaeon]
IPVLDINRELRNQSIHSEPTYKLIKSSKKPIQILSEDVIRLTNNLGEIEIVLLHDLDEMGVKRLLDEAYKTGNVALRVLTETTPLLLDEAYKTGNPPLASWMLYGELLRDEVLECIRQIDLK